MTDDLPGHIARFRIDGLIGVGGMGSVYKAFDPNLQRTVAIKTVRSDATRPEFHARLYREAKACARLQHRNVVTIFEAGEHEGLVYIAMEYLRGESLVTALQQGTLTFDAKLRILMQILDALHHVHGEHVIHRDIKPSNINLQPDGSIKLIDFGIARVDPETATTLTKTGTIFGTPRYSSPEQLRGEDVDHRTDIYSTGALAYEMVSGSPPFDGGNLAAIVLRVLSKPPAPIDNTWSYRFPAIELIIRRSMEKSAADRYQTATEMRNAISQFWRNSKDQIDALQAEIDRVLPRPLANSGLSVHGVADTQTHSGTSQAASLDRRVTMSGRAATLWAVATGWLARLVRPSRGEP